MNNKYIPLPSPNCDQREGFIDKVVLHYTAGNFESSKNWLTNPKAEVSAHYLVNTDGKIYQLVDESMRAWHAGRSYWNGETGLNHSSIGIEIVNLGNAENPNFEEFPDVQIQGVLSLCQDISSRYRIVPYDFISHSDIASGRKIDVGPLFPWQKFADLGFGFYPKAEEYQKKSIPKDFDFFQSLGKFGFDIKNTETAIKLFKIHYFPQEYLSNNWEIQDDHKKMILSLNELKELSTLKMAGEFLSRKRIFS